MQQRGEVRNKSKGFKKKKKRSLVEYERTQTAGG